MSIPLGSFRASGPMYANELADKRIADARFRAAKATQLFPPIDRSMADFAAPASVQEQRNRAASAESVQAAS